MSPETNLPVQQAPQGAEVSAAYAKKAYSNQGRKSQEDRWILENLPLVRHIVNKIAGNLSRHDDMDDLLSAGTLGLVKAARAYDPSKEAEFRTYAYVRIRGAVLDELRSRSFTPPRAIKQLNRVREIYRRLTDLNGQGPDDDVLAAELGISLEQLYRVLAEARKQHFLCIHGLVEGQGGLQVGLPLDGLPSPMDQAERKEMAEALAQAILELPQRQRHVLVLYYERDLTMKEIAQVLEITEARVSQIHSSALFRLSMKLNQEARTASGRDV